MTAGLRIGSLFAGIGGLELGLERAGVGSTVWQVEIDPFCRQVLAKNWPNAKRYDDVRTVGSGNLTPVDLICGGFPCQDVSSAGKRIGLDGHRSGLWYEYLRIVGEMRPSLVLVENVASGGKLWVDLVRNGLGQLGYESLPIPLAARDVGAPHLRERIFIVAHAHGAKLRDKQGWRCGPDREGSAIPRDLSENGRAIPHTASRRWETGPSEPLTNDGTSREGGPSYTRRVHSGTSSDNGDTHLRGEPASAEHGEMARVRSVAGDASPWAIAPDLRGMDDGVSRRMDRLRALGNAVVPQCAEVIGHVILQLAGL